MGKIGLIMIFQDSDYDKAPAIQIIAKLFWYQLHLPSHISLGEGWEFQATNKSKIKL